MMKVAATAGKKAGKKAAKTAGKKAVKKAGKKAVKKAGKKAVKKTAKKQVKKQAKKQAKKQIKKQTKKQAKKQVKKQAKKQAKKQTKKQAKKKVKKTAKDKAKKKMKKKAKEKGKKKAKKKMKDKVKKKVKEEMEEMMEDLKEDAMNEIQAGAEDWLYNQLAPPAPPSEEESSSDEGENQDKQKKRRKSSIKVYEQVALPPRFAERPGLLKIIICLIFKILTCCCWLLCKCLGKVFRDRTPAEAKCCWKWMCVPGSYPNSLAKSIGGFLLGCILSFVFYCIFIFIIGYDWKRAVTTTSFVGFIFCFGLAFSVKVRCIVMLMIPQFFTGKGRTILMTYGYVLLLGGPLANLSYNMDAASRSQACGSALAMNQSSTIFEIVTAPLSGIIDDIESMIDTVKVLVKKAHDAFMALVDAVKAIGDAIEAFFEWLENSVDRCNEKMGKPVDICYDKFEEGERNCRKKGLGFLCNIVSLTTKLCEVAGMGKLLCAFPAAINFIVSRATAGFTVAVDELEKQFYVDFEFTHNFELNANFSKTPEDIKNAIIDEIGERTSTMRSIIFWVSYLLSFTVIFLFYKALGYRAKYLTKDKFDNVYITDQFIRLEEKRRAKKKFTVLPLTDREAKSYIRPFSLRLAKTEHRKMILGLLAWFYQAGYASLVIFADVCAFSFLRIVRKNVELTVQQEVPGSIHLKVQGEGLLADVYRTLTATLDPASHANISIDTTKCLPNPNPPDAFNYCQIGGIFGICLILVLTESYGRRLRRVAAAYYYPEREKYRVVWLYNHIMRRRGSLLDAFRLKFNKEGPNKNQEDIGIRSKLAASSGLCRRLLACCGYKRKFCLECGLPGETSNHDNFKHCESPGCEAVYCLECVREINNMCSLCMNPVDYDECSDFSEERDSSDEECVSRKDTRDYSYHSEEKQGYLLRDEYDEEQYIGDDAGWEDEYELAENYGIDEEYEDIVVDYYVEDNDHG